MRLTILLWRLVYPQDHFANHFPHQLYHDALCTLNEDLGSGMVSPSLMGSNGVVPLTIISW